MTTEGQTKQDIATQEVVRLEQDVEIQSIIAKRDKLISRMLSMEVIDDDSLKVASEMRNTVQGFFKESESYKLNESLPFRTRTDAINKFFNSILTPVKDAQGRIEKQILDYRTKIREAQAKEQARLDKVEANRQRRAEESGKPSPIPEAIAPVVSGNVKSVRADDGSSLSFREDWKMRIVNESLIPREYLMPDLRKLDGVAGAMKGDTNVPGCVAYMNEIPVSRR